MLSRDLNVRVSVVYSELWMDAQRIELYEDMHRMLHGVVDYATGHLYNIGELYYMDLRWGLIPGLFYLLDKPANHFAVCL